MVNSIRTFIAVTLNPEIRQEITHIQDHFKKLDCNIKWIEPQNIHLTLKFLGDVKLKKIDTLKEALSDLFDGVRPIKSELTQPGAFPDNDHPRVLWVGLNDDKGRIVELAALLEGALGNIGFKKDPKPFCPHITIGRIRSTKNLSHLSQALSGYSRPLKIKLTLQNIVLYKSTLTSQGPFYEPLHKVKLK